MATAKPAWAQNESTILKLEEEMRELESRLLQGEGIVRQEKERGSDRDRVDYLEMHWVRLLRNYELLFDRLQRQRAARRAPPMEPVQPEAELANEKADSLTLSRPPAGSSVGQLL